MSDEPQKGGGSSIGASPLTIIVKGGTTSSAYDNERERQKAAAEAGRAHQEKQEEAARFGAGMTEGGFVHSKLTSMRMMDNGSPRVVFYYMNKDKTVRQECVSELVLTLGDELFTLACPKCLERKESHGSSQIMVKKSHRYWELDWRPPSKGGVAGTLVRLKDPYGKEFFVRLAGTITVQDIIRCSNLGCTWAVQIDKSEVWEV